MSPLKPGRSKATIGRNVEEMMASFKRTGKIGNTTPRNVKHARRIASAAAHTKAENTGKQQRRRRK